MSPDLPRQAPAVRTAHEVLEAAVRRLGARIGDVYPSLAPGGTERAEAYLVTMHAKLVEVLDGADPEPLRRWLSASPLFRPLMEALGVELIEGGAADPESAPTALAVLSAWLAMRERRTVSSEEMHRESAEGLRAHMRGPQAFDLLVEVAHDFRSPLTSILFLAEALRDGHSGPVTDIQRSQLGLIYSAAFGLASIASDVMDLARQEKDLITDEAEPFAPAEVFQSVERMVRPLVEEKGLELRVVVPERWQARGHPHALSRVLLNLTTNALKFTDEGSVEIGLRPLPHGRLEYYVQDTGRGITPEQKRDLFKPFRRRSAREEDGHYFSGSGIGLSIARRLLQAMGSDLTLDSSDETGTRFSFLLAAPSSGR
jgi:signal transduction histidine kinase